MILLKFFLYCMAAMLFGAVFFELSYVIYTGIVYPSSYRDREDWFDEERRNIETYFLTTDIEVVEREEKYFMEDTNETNQ